LTKTAGKVSADAADPVGLRRKNSLDDGGFSSPFLANSGLDPFLFGVIDTRHITTRYFPLAAANEALDYIKTRGDNDPLGPVYAAE
jgi:hypothetical protein